MTAAPPPSSPPAPPPADPPPADPPPWEPPPWAPPPPPGPPHQRVALRRSTTDKMLGGVAGGLADYSGIDALLWRVGFVALALIGPGVPIYLLLWLLTPAGPAGTGASAAGRSAAGRSAARRASAGPRSPVPGITVAGLLIVVGVLVLLSRVTGWDPGARGFLGSALLVVGLGLVGAAFTAGGRGARRGLIGLGVLLALALAAASTGPWDRVRGGVGERTFHPLSAAAVQGTYDAGIGNTTVDLSAVDLADAPTPIRTHVDGGVGNLHVVLPASADVQVTVDEGLGNVDVLNNGSTDGFYRGTGSASWTGDDRPEFVISIDAGIGNVEVDRG